MAWLESRIQVAEQRIEMLYRRLLDALATLDNVRQQLRGAYQQLPAGGGSGQQTLYLSCTLSTALAHGSSVTNQTVWKLTGGVRVNVSTNAVIYNDGPTTANDIASGKQVILLPNEDGSFAAVGVYC